MVNTIRVGMGNTYTGSYTLQDQNKVAINLTAATPNGVVLNLYTVDAGTLVASTPCVIGATPTTGLVTYTLGDICTATRQMLSMQFVVTKSTGDVLTAPGGQEQGLWVY